MTNNQLQRMVARCVLGLTEQADVVELAQILAELGHSLAATDDRPGVLDQSAAATCRRLLDVVQDIGIPVPTERKAVLMLSREIAAAIVGGQQDWLAGSEAIWKIEIATPERIPELDTFLYAAMEAEANPNLAKSFKAGVLEAARDLLNLPEAE
jgi:hypothetical protein